MDIIFIYKFDFRPPATTPPPMGKIRLPISTSTSMTPLIDEIAPHIIDTINQSNQTWHIDRKDIMIDIVSHTQNTMPSNAEPFLYSLFIDIQTKRFFYNGEIVVPPLLSN